MSDSRMPLHQVSHSPLTAAIFLGSIGKLRLPVSRPLDPLNANVNFPADGKCRLWIRMDGTQPDTTTWSELWLTSAALNDMCLWRGWAGVADKLGKSVPTIWL